MRPRKRILLIDSNEVRLSVRRYLLETQGFKVSAATAADEARDLAETTDPELIVCAWPLAGSSAGLLLNQLHEAHPFVRIMLLAETLQSVPDDVYAADAVLLKGDCTPFNVLERARLLSARKRGPRKMTVQSVDRMMDFAARRIA